ncbi:MAG: ABC transporter ATP-binding protein [Caldisericia bacterium]|nr:ABC transporter ATP-binding protein [Caldisericia bacterium]
MNQKEKFFSLRARNISRCFGNIKANNSIDFSIEAGQIMALLGENGAGKTTFVRILSGLDQPDSGEILLNDQSVYFNSCRTAQKMGVGIIHQHFMLVQSMTVAENIALCDTDSSFIYSENKINDKMKKFEEEYGFFVNPNAKICQLSAGEQQRVEIIKALFRGTNVLILDEPTSVLTPQEADKLFVILQKMKNEGKAIVFISHKLREIMDYTDAVTVLRHGNLVGCRNVNDITQDDLISMMTGEKKVASIRKENVAVGENILKVASITVLDDRESKSIKNMSFEIKKNEIFGIAGIAGNGQRELVEAITGMRNVSSGKIFIYNEEVQNSTPKHVYSKGVAHIPEERIRFGIASGLKLFENTSIRNYEQRPYSKQSIMNYKAIKLKAQTIIEAFHVKTESVDTEIQNLSGGNMQKLIVGREMVDSPKLIVASHPTYGLDIASTKYIQQELLTKSKEGAGVLLISEDIDELMALSDRIAVVFRGELMGVLNREDVTIHKIGLLMAGEELSGENNNG